MTELTLSRNFLLTPAQVFDFVTRHEHISKWWGPEGMTVPVCEIDFTKTGPWVSVMVNAEGGRHKVSGMVKQINAPHSVEFTWGWHDDNDDRGHESRVRFDIKSDGRGGTDFKLTHAGLVDDESASKHTTGWSSSLRKLDLLVL